MREKNRRRRKDSKRMNARKGSPAVTHWKQDERHSKRETKGGDVNKIKYDFKH